MNIIATDTFAEALAAWMLDAPPIAHPCPDPMTMAAVRIRETGSWPTALLDTKPHDIVGVTPSGWLAIAGAGWRHFRGTTADLARIATACNTAQIAAFADRSLFDFALHCHAKRRETGRISGLEWIETEDGHCWICFDDITQLDVRAAFHHCLKTEGGEDMLRIRYNLGSRQVSKTFAKADAWWLFARNWTKPLSTI